MVKYTIIPLFSILTTFLLMEVSVRIVLPQSDRFYVHDPFALHLRPNVTGMWYGQHPLQRELAVLVQTNRYGFRDTEHSIEKGKGETRIAVVGDSFIEGFQVPIEETFPKQLQSLLQSSGRNTEVLSFGKSGLGVREKILLAEQSLVFSPSLVILTLNSTDLNDAIETAVSPRYATTVDTFLEYSHVARLLARSLNHSFSSREALLPPLPVPHLGKRGEIFDGWKKDIMRLAKREPGLKFVLLVDALTVVRAACQEDEIEEEWREFVNAIDKDAVILGKNMCLFHSEEDPLYYPFDRHWTARAHRFAAEFMLPVVLRQLKEKV